MTPPDRRTYLGDGVYANYDGHNIVLTVEDGIKTTSTVYLEPQVLAALIHYNDMIYAEKKTLPHPDIHVACSPEAVDEVLEEEKE